MATKNSTNDTANENFMTDHGSMRLTNRRARRGPREAAPDTAARAVRTASAIFPLAGTVRVRGCVPVPVVSAEVWGSSGVARPAGAPNWTREAPGTVARPVLVTL